jgi:hypothetical protein
MEAELHTQVFMSKNINVNPGQYKVAGRERQGEDINPALERAKLTKNQESGRPQRAARKGAKRKP